MPPVTLEQNSSFPQRVSRNAGPRPHGARRQSGFTLLELMLAIALFSVLAMLAMSAYGAVMKRVRNGQAAAEIGEIQLAIRKFDTNNGVLPDSLADVGFGGRLDPWGNAYRYLNFTGLNSVSAMRKDRNLVPINTDYDLYSSGPDGASVPPLTAKASQDDIVRANDGRYIGPAADY